MICLTFDWLGCGKEETPIYFPSFYSGRILLTKNRLKCNITTHAIHSVVDHICSPKSLSYFIDFVCLFLNLFIVLLESLNNVTKLILIKASVKLFESLTLLTPLAGVLSTHYEDGTI